MKKWIIDQLTGFLIIIAVTIPLGILNTLLQNYR